MTRHDEEKRAKKIVQFYTKIFHTQKNYWEGTPLFFWGVEK